MKLSVFSPALADMTLEEMLKFLTDHGVYSVEKNSFVMIKKFKK